MRLSHVALLGLLAAQALAPSHAGAQVATGHVSDAADGTSAAGASWRAFQAQSRDPAACTLGAAAGEEIGILRPDGFWIDRIAWLPSCGPARPVVVAVELSIADARPPRFRAGYFAATLGPSGIVRAIEEFPSTQLAAIPVPSATLACPDVVLSWSPVDACSSPATEAMGVAAHAIFRSPAGTDAFVEVGRTTGAAGFTDFVDRDVPPGTWVWATGIVFGNPDGTPSVELSAATPAITIGAPPAGEVELRVAKAGADLEFSWGPADPSVVRHHLHAGDLADVPDAARFGQREAIACSLPLGPSLALMDDPAGAGVSRYYLLALAGGTCAERAGDDSLGNPRPATIAACP